MIWPVPETDRPASLSLARPKSATLTTPSLEIRMFAGLMSRCTMPILWAAPRATATRLAIASASWIESFFLSRRIASRLLPSTYCMQM